MTKTAGLGCIEPVCLQRVASGPWEDHQRVHAFPALTPPPSTWFPIQTGDPGEQTLAEYSCYTTVRVSSFSQFKHTGLYTQTNASVTQNYEKCLK